LITATAGDSAQGEGNLDASYIISFARTSVVSGTVRGLALGTGICRPDSERSSHFVCLQWLGSVSPALMALRVHNGFSRTVSPRGERDGGG
jgi:hypothetical protein